MPTCWVLLKVSFSIDESASIKQIWRSILLWQRARCAGRPLRGSPGQKQMACIFGLEVYFRSPQPCVLTTGKLHRTHSSIPIVSVDLHRVSQNMQRWAYETLIPWEGTLTLYCISYPFYGEINLIKAAGWVKSRFRCCCGVGPAPWSSNGRAGAILRTYSSGCGASSNLIPLSTSKTHTHPATLAPELPGTIKHS